MRCVSGNNSHMVVYNFGVLLTFAEKNSLLQPNEFLEDSQKEISAIHPPGRQIIYCYDFRKLHIKMKINDAIIESSAVNQKFITQNVLWL